MHAGALTAADRELTIPRIDMGKGRKTEGARVDERGIRPPAAYAVGERAAPAGVVVLELSGEFDSAAAGMLRRRFEDALARGPLAVVADMTEVTFADSSALRELLRADATMRAAGSRFVPAALPPVVDRLLELTRARELLDVAPSVDAALTRLDGHR
jgi:anti-anti-sigma factor